MKRDETKTKMLGVKVGPTEKLEIEELAKINGFDNVSAFILWLIRHKQIFGNV